MLAPYLRRITSNDQYIPELDGLRFIAIFMVIFCHINELLFNAGQFQYTDGIENYSVLNDWMKHGYFGVDIFFAISGFILALPFAKKFRENPDFPSLKNYFIRRLTRLEPPYILSLIVMYVILVFILELKTNDVLLPSFFSSLFYVHNFCYGREVFPLLNNVIWSLEVEVQFYILAPFILFGLYKFKKYRKWILIFFIFLISGVSKFWKPEFYSLYEYFHFFLIGILLVEIYLDQKQVEIQKNSMLVALGSIPLFFAFFIGIKLTDITYLGKISDGYKLFLSSIQLLLLIAFFYLTLVKKWWPLFFQNTTVCILGGMCYSLYLVHNPVISGLGYYFFNRYHDNYFYKTYQLYFPYLLTAVILMGLMFYVLVERPTMKKNWWKRKQKHPL